jgi:hypothetical protein
MELATPYLQLYFKDGILIGHYIRKVHIDLAMAQEIVRTRLAFTKGKTYPTMILGHGIVSMNKPAREYLSSTAATEGLSATAIVVNSEFHRILGNFFISVNRAPMPVRIFKDMARAEKWLQKFIE